MTKLFLSALLFLCPIISYPSMNPMLIKDKISSYNAAEYIGFYKDSTLIHTIHTVSDPLNDKLFKPVTDRNINMGIDDKIYWFRFDIDNRSNGTQWHIDMEVPVINQVKVYLQKSNGEILKLCEGGLEIRGKRFLENKSSLHCPLPLETNQINRVYIQVQTSSYLILPVWIRSTESLIRKNQEKTGFLYFFIGIIVAAILMNLILFFITRDTHYFLLFAALVLMTITGFFQYGIELWPNMPVFLKIRMRILTVSAVFMLLSYLISQLLELKKYRLFHQLYNLLLYILVAYILLIVAPFIPNSYMNKISPYIALLITVTYFITSIYFILKKNSFATYLLLYVLGFLISFSIWYLLLNNYIGYSLLSFHANFISGSMFGILLTLGVTSKIKEFDMVQFHNRYYRSINQQLQTEIDERKKIELELRENEEKYRQIFNLSPEAIILTELKTGKIIEFNNKLCEITGYDKEYITGKSTIDLKLIGENKRNELIGLLQSTNRIIGIELSFSTETGETKHCILNSILLNIPEEPRIISVLSDITSLINNQIEIRKLSTAVENSANSIIITSPDGTIEYVNPAFSQISGYHYSEVVGKKPSILKSSYHTQQFYKELWEKILNGNTWKGEFFNKNKNGNLFWERATISPVINRDTGAIINFVAIKEDITESKQQMEELIRSENQLRELNATKDKFFSIIAHDLMDPFNAMFGFSNLLVEAINNNANTDSLNYAGIIKQSALRIFNLLQNLLLWSRSQSNKIRIQPQVVNIHEMVKDVLSVLGPSANNKKIDLRLNIDNNLKAFIDYNLISTVIRNLTMNAIKFTGEKGIVEISASIENEILHFLVSDTGIGIKKEHMKHLFNIDNTFISKGTEDETGTGLGLIICKEFVEFHGGTIWAESVYGHGSKFIFTIPAGMNIMM